MPDKINKQFFYLRQSEVAIDNNPSPRATMWCPKGPNQYRSLCEGLSEFTSCEEAIRCSRCTHKLSTTNNNDTNNKQERNRYAGHPHDSRVGLVAYTPGAQTLDPVGRGTRAHTYLLIPMHAVRARAFFALSVCACVCSPQCTRISRLSAHAPSPRVIFTSKEFRGMETKEGEKQLI